ncbi:hypothetical protein [Photobacterium atrarenae]|uniref:Uncharacterized protein n=1 Tax=Photobacterium atrarenae TaxID=865757 RepID=A0ABY5GEG6_9GAMM|nr:hypothetical protein [Photobacterium atrarenae]UTV27510.1 hypothetical protein NNL38_14535 [Photobacterium atrarenae]
MQVSNPIHAPCPDMEGMVNPDPKKRQRAIYLLGKLREKHGIRRRTRTARPLNYTCTSTGCIEGYE